MKLSSSRCMLFLGRSGGGPAFAFSKFKTEFDKNSILICAKQNELIDIYKIAFGDQLRIISMPSTMFEIKLYFIFEIFKILKICWNSREVYITAYHPILIILMPILKLIRVKIVYVLHDVVPHKKNYLENIIQYLLQKVSEKIIVLSKTQADAYKKKYGKKPYLESHPPYLHYKYYKKTSKQVFSHVKFLFLGRIEEYKGLEFLSGLENTLPILCGKTILRIAGKGHLPNCLLNKPHIDVINKYIQDKDIPSLIDACDYIVLPYKSATQSGLFGIADEFNKSILATPLEVFKDQSKEVKSCVYFSEHINKNSFLLLLKERYYAN